MQVLLIDESVAVLVNHVECLLELLNLSLAEHSEDIGGGALGTLLGDPTAGGGAAGRHAGCWKKTHTDWSIVTDPSIQFPPAARKHDRYDDIVTARAVTLQ